MSADVLKLIPADPHFVPDHAAQGKAVVALEALLPEGEMCEAALRRLRNLAINLGWLAWPILAKRA